MEEFNLSSQEIQELRSAHKSIRAKREAYKINAVILLGCNWTISEVSEALLMDEETIRSYFNKYIAGGVASLLEIFHCGSNKKLNSEQILKLEEELENNVYLTTKEICAYVKSNFDIEYTVSGMTDLLHNLDFVYKKPKLVPSKSDIDAQEIFVGQYLKFMENKSDDDLVFFVDAVHPVHNSMPAYGWIKKGKEHELNSNTGRSRLNIHGAMNAETFDVTVLTTEGSINTESTIELLEYLEFLYPLAVIIYVILDNAKYHYSLEVQDFLKNSKIRLIFLPTYSPELNLIERLWKIFKKNVLYNKYYEKFSDFKNACNDFFKNQDSYHNEIESIMGEGLEALF